MCTADGYADATLCCYVASGRHSYVVTTLRTACSVALTPYWTSLTCRLFCLTASTNDALKTYHSIVARVMDCVRHGHAQVPANFVPHHLPLLPVSACCIYNLKACTSPPIAAPMSQHPVCFAESARVRQHTPWIAGLHCLSCYLQLRLPSTGTVQPLSRSHNCAVPGLTMPKCTQSSARAIGWPC